MRRRFASEGGRRSTGGSVPGNWSRRRDRSVAWGLPQQVALLGLLVRGRPEVYGPFSAIPGSRSPLVLAEPEARDRSNDPRDLGPASSEPRVPRPARHLRYESNTPGGGVSPEFGPCPWL